MAKTKHGHWNGGALKSVLAAAALCSWASIAPSIAHAQTGPEAEHPWSAFDSNGDAALTAQEFAVAQMTELRPLDVNNDRLYSRSEFLANRNSDQLFLYASWFDESDFDGDAAWSIGELEDYLVLRFLEYDFDQDALLRFEEWPDTPQTEPADPF